MSSVIVLEWKFSPPDYFESPTEIEQDNYTMTIDNCKAEAKIDSEVYEANPLMRDALHKAPTVDSSVYCSTAISYTIYQDRL